MLVTTAAFLPKDVAITRTLLLYRIINEQKCLVLFSFPHRTYVLGISVFPLTEAVLINIQNICSH